MKHPVLFVYNPKAGRQFDPLVTAQISNLLHPSVTARFIDINSLDKINGNPLYSAIVAVGGDGTVNTVAEKAIQWNIPLGIIPKGSGDGLARHLNIPKDIKGALEIIEAGHTISCDSASLSGRFFINVAGTGFEAKVAHKFGEGGIRGLIGYIRTIISIFFSHGEKNANIRLDGEKKKIHYFSLSIANGTQWGNDFEIARSADIQDGLLEIAVMKKPKWNQIISLIISLKNKKHHKSPLITYYKAAAVDIRKSGKKWHIDGEPLLLKRKNKITIKPSSISIIVARN